MEGHYTESVLAEHERKYEDWIAKARAAAVEIAMRTGQCTADNIWCTCPPPSTVNPKAIAAVFQPRKTWQKVGYVGSIRRECHRRPIAIWKLREDADV